MRAAAAYVPGEDRTGGAMAKVTKEVVVETPLERFYDLVVDYERYPEFVPGIHGCRILKREPE